MALQLFQHFPAVLGVSVRPLNLCLPYCSVLFSHQYRVGAGRLGRGGCPCYLVRNLSTVSALLFILTLRLDPWNPKWHNTTLQEMFSDLRLARVLVRRFSARIFRCV